MFKPFMEHKIIFLGHKNIYIHKNVHSNISCDHTFLWIKKIQD